MYPVDWCGDVEADVQDDSQHAPNYTARIGPTRAKQVDQMKRTIGALCFLPMFLSPAIFGAGLVSDISAHLSAPDPKQRYTACIVLAELPLDGETETRLRNLHKTKSKELDSLCLGYILAKRTQERAYQDEFIKLYPSGQQQADVLQRHAAAGYPFGVRSPLSTHLADLARTSDAALAKLASGLPFADGAYAEILVDELASLYQLNPGRVNRALHSASANAHAQLIKETASQKERQCE